MTDEQRAIDLLDAARTRGDIGRLAPLLDADEALRRAVWVVGRERGAPLDEEALRWPARRLLRVARNREAAARARSNPIARDEPFVCGHCGRAVPPHGRTARNHCPWCLRSRHVDVVPGDRASDCGGLMDPSSVELAGGRPVVVHRCRTCGATARVRALLDGDVPDDWSVIVSVSAGERP